jgi:hypothetical protein
VARVTAQPFNVLLALLLEPKVQAVVLGGVLFVQRDLFVASAAKVFGLLVLL